MDRRKAKACFGMVGMALCFLLIGVDTVMGTITLRLDNTGANTGDIPLQTTLYLLEDPTHSLTITDVLTETGRFTRNSEGRTSYGYSGSAFWIRFTVSKDAENHTLYYLKHTYPHLDTVWFYAPEKDGTYGEIRTGDTLPFRQRQFPNRLFIFPLNPDENGTTYFMRIASKGAVNFALSIVDAPTFYQADHNSQLAAGLYFGALLIMAAYNILFFAFVRERLYLFYAAHVLFIAIQQVIYFGLGFEYLWPEHPALNNLLDIFASCGLFFFLGLFVMDFLNTRKNTPRLHLVLVVTTLLNGFGAGLVFFVERGLILGPTNNLGIVHILLLFVIAAVCFIRRVRQAYIFLAAWSLALAGALFVSLYKTGLIPEIPILVHSVQLGILCNVLLISLGLADRINQMKKQIQAQNRKLIVSCDRLEMSEKRFRELAELLPQTVFELDMTGNVTYSNRHGLDTSGYSREDLQEGVHVFRLFDDRDHEKIEADMADILSTRAVHQNEYMLVKKDGSRIPVLLYTSLILAEGRPAGFRGVLVDLSERKRTEAMMIQTEKMMSVGGLAAGMAHEINNPLAGMIQSAQVVQNRLTKQLPGNEKAARDLGITMADISAFMAARGIFRHLDNIQEAGARAAKIIDNMLSFARESKAVKQPHRLDEIMDATIELAQNDYDLKKRYDFRSIRIQKQYDPDVPAVQCERTKIQQVFFNIIKNASEAMAAGADETGTPQLHIRLTGQNGSVRIEIADNGPGMDEITRNKVFEPFFTTKGLDSGTGLGLSVSYFIVKDDHGGEMEVVSAPGEGARFIIHLPVESPGTV